MTLDVSRHDRFVLRRRIEFVVDEYEFSIPGEGEEAGDGEPIWFVLQRRFKFKVDIGFFADDRKSTPLMRILARQRLDPKARYDIAAADGGPIGQIQKRLRQVPPQLDVHALRRRRRRGLRRPRQSRWARPSSAASSAQGPRTPPASSTAACSRRRRSEWTCCRRGRARQAGAA